MTEKLKVNCIDHISIAVRDLKQAEEDFRRVFGWEVDGRYSDHDEKINVAYFMIGPTALEISLASSRCCIWSSPTGTAWAL